MIVSGFDRILGNGNIWFVFCLV